MGGSPVLDIKVIGQFQITVNGEPASGFESDKVRALLAYLAVENHQPQARGKLAAMFWPDRPEVTARRNLSQALANLRTVIGDRSASPPFLIISHQAIQFNQESNSQLDLILFNKLLQAIEDHAHKRLETCPNCTKNLVKAVALGSGNFLEALSLPELQAFDEWYLVLREKLHRQRIQTVNRLIQCYYHQESYNDALKYAWMLLEIDRWREETYRLLMQLLALTGQRSDALAQYEACRRILDEVFGVKPDQKTVELYQQIKAGQIFPQEKSSTHEYDISLSQPSYLGSGSVEKYKEVLFVGRDKIINQLTQTLSEALHGNGKVTFVYGGTGRGKTTLIQTFLHQAIRHHHNLLAAGGSSNAFTGAGDPFLPFREILATLTGDFEIPWSTGKISRNHAIQVWDALPATLQHLVSHGPLLIDTLLPGNQLIARIRPHLPEEIQWFQTLEDIHQRHTSAYPLLQQPALLDQYSSFIRSLAQEHPLLLILDDLQWADRGSINLLFHLGRQINQSQVMILGAYRPEEIYPNHDGVQHPLEQVIAEFRRQHGETWIDLSQIQPSDEQAFVNAFLDTKPNHYDADFREKFHQKTQGHPLFTLELERDMEARGYLVRDRDGYWIPSPSIQWNYLPARLEAVIASRLNRLNRQQRQLLETASIEGEIFTAEVLSAVNQIPLSITFEILEQICSRHLRLVTELGDVKVLGEFRSQYQFNHPLFCSFLYQKISTGKRRYLHGKVAESLEELYGDKSERITVELARHYDEAGNIDKTVQYLLDAGRQAQTAAAKDEAAAYYQRTRELLKSSPSTLNNKIYDFKALLGLGVIAMNTSQFVDAETYLLMAKTIGEDINIPYKEMIILYHWLAEVYAWQNRPEDRIRIGKKGLALLGEDKVSIEAALMNQAVAMGYWLSGDHKNFREYTQKTSGFIRDLPYSPEILVAYIHIAILHSENKKVDQTLQWLEALEKQAKMHHDIRFLGEVSSYTGDLLYETGDFNTALIRLKQAQDIFDKMGDRGQEPGGCSSLIGWLYLSSGNLEAAFHWISKALETSQKTGIPRWIAKNTCLIGQYHLTNFNLAEAMAALKMALKLSEESNDQKSILLNRYLIGRLHLAVGNPLAAKTLFEKILNSVSTRFLSGEFINDPHFLYKLSIGSVLDSLETAYERLQNQGALPAGGFQAYCNQFRNDHLNLSQAPFSTWYLEPAVPKENPSTLSFNVDLGNPLDKDWTWIDTFGDCRWFQKNGLIIEAVNGRDMRHLNLSAPHFVRSVLKDFIIEINCQPGNPHCPSIGGILLWFDKRNFLCLEWGRGGDREISFQGNIENQDLLLGRGRLPEHQVTSAFLRMERTGRRVKAYCSRDGKVWYTVGSCSFTPDNPVDVGIFAAGTIPREIYPAPHPNGTAIQFTSLRLWMTKDRENS